MAGAAERNGMALREQAAVGVFTHHHNHRRSGRCYEIVRLPFGISGRGRELTPCPGPEAVTLGRPEWSDGSGIITDPERIRELEAKA